MATGMNFSGLPELVINPGDVSNSWKRWREVFLIAIELKTIKWGTRIVANAPVILFRAIGQEGRHAITAMGFNVQDTAAKYERA